MADPAPNQPIPAAVAKELAMLRRQVNNLASAVNHLRSAINQLEKNLFTPPPGGTEQVRWMSGCRSVMWFGTEYNFTAAQGAAMEILLRAWENQTPDVSVNWLLAQISSGCRRMEHLFRDHQAWGTLIVPGKTKGTIRLKKT